jgi:hypothetical protein
VAYYNERDVHHKKALELVKKSVDGYFGELFTSDYVFDEAVTVTLVKTSVEKALELGEHILNSEITMLKVGEDAFSMAWKEFKKADMSFTDCTIVSLMRLNGIDRLMTFDEGFKKVQGIAITP